MLDGFGGLGGANEFSRFWALFEMEGQGLGFRGMGLKDESSMGLSLQALVDKRWFREC